MRGRKPKPTALKELEGFPGKRKPNANEPKPRPGTPPCPQSLSPKARQEWKRITAELRALNLLTQLDRAALAIYCNAWARWVEAEEQVAKLGAVVKSPSGFPIQNPYLAIANAAGEHMRKIMTEFGLTPASRTRISTGGPQQQQPGSDLAKFCSERPPLRLAQ